VTECRSWSLLHTSVNMRAVSAKEARFAFELNVASSTSPPRLWSNVDGAVTPVSGPARLCCWKDCAAAARWAGWAGWGLISRGKKPKEGGFFLQVHSATKSGEYLSSGLHTNVQNTPGWRFATDGLTVADRRMLGCRYRNLRSRITWSPYLKRSTMLVPLIRNEGERLNTNGPFSLRESGPVLMPE